MLAAQCNRSHELDRLKSALSCGVDFCRCVNYIFKISLELFLFWGKGGLGWLFTVKLDVGVISL